MNAVTKTTSYRPQTVGDVMANHGIKQIRLIEQLKADGMPITRSPARLLRLNNVWPSKYCLDAMQTSVLKLFTQPLTNEERDVMTAKPEEAAPRIYHAKHVLEAHGFSQKQALDAVKATGVKCSQATLNMFLNNGYCPKSLTLDQLKQPIEQLLTGEASDEELAKLWHVTERLAPRRGSRAAVKKTTVEPVPVEPAEPAIIFEPLEPEMLYQNTMQHFNLFSHPFENELHSVNDLFLSNGHTRVREAMVQAATRGGMLAVIAECGAGKTTMRHAFNEYVQEHHPELIVIEPTVIEKQRLTGAMILEAIADELGITSMPRSVEARARKVLRTLQESAKAKGKHCLVIEEAHDLTNDAFKYLKRIWELSAGLNRLISIVLVGQPELEDKLSVTNHEIREFSFRCNTMSLPPLGLELTDYIAHKFQCVRADHKKIITPCGIEAMRTRLTATVGRGLNKATQQKDMTYPLSVHTLLIKALNLAASVGESIIDADVIAEIK